MKDGLTGMQYNVQTSFFSVSLGKSPEIRKKNSVFLECRGGCEKTFRGLCRKKGARATKNFKIKSRANTNKRSQTTFEIFATRPTNQDNPPDQVHKNPEIGTRAAFHH